jgi:hypothetical protein
MLPCGSRGLSLLRTQRLPQAARKKAFPKAKQVVPGRANVHAKQFPPRTEPLRKEGPFPLFFRPAQSITPDFSDFRTAEYH